MSAQQITPPVPGLTFRQQLALKPERKSRRAANKVKPNAYDRLVRRLQSRALEAVYKDDDGVCGGQDANLRQHLGRVNRGRDARALSVRSEWLPELVANNDGRVGQIQAWLRRWLRCEKVGNGSRNGQRCDDRLCMNCAAIHGAKAYKAVLDRVAANSTLGDVHFVTVAKQYRAWESPEALSSSSTGLPAAIDDLRQDARSAIKQLGAFGQDAAVLTSVVAVHRHNAGSGVPLIHGVSVKLTATAVFVADHVPTAIYRNSWIVRSVEPTSHAVGEKLEDLVKVTPGTITLPCEWFWALRGALKGMKCLDFRGKWRTNAGKCVGAPTVRTMQSSVAVSPAAGHFLAALASPPEWAQQQSTPLVTLDWISNSALNDEGELMPFRIREHAGPIDVEDLQDAQAVSRLLEHTSASTDARPLATAWQTTSGQWMLCYPAKVERGAPRDNQGNRSCLVIRHRRETYLVTPLVSPRIIRLLWQKWSMPWAKAHAKPPRYADVPPVHPSLVQMMGINRFDVDGRKVESSEDRRAVIELCRAMNIGRTTIRRDFGEDWFLRDATKYHLGGRLLQAMYRCHGQTMEGFFGWSGGLVAGQLVELSRQRGSGVSLPIGVVFNLYRERPKRTGTRRRSKRLVLHNDRTVLGLDKHGMPSPSAKVLGLVTVKFDGRPVECFLQSTSDYYRCVRERQPQLVNPDPLPKHDRWLPGVQVREYARRKRVADALADSIARDHEQQEYRHFLVENHGSVTAATAGPSG